MSEHARLPESDCLRQRLTACASSHFGVGHLYAVADAEDSDAGTILVERIHPSWHYLCHYPGLCHMSYRKLERHGVQANFHENGNAGVPYFVVQLRHTFPHDFYPSSQLRLATTVADDLAPKVGVGVNCIASHMYAGELVSLLV